MLNNKGVSIVALVVTIIMIILIAAISAPLLTSIIDDSLEQDAKVELKNVENVVDYARTQIKIDEFVPNESYVIKDDELEAKFGRVLTEEDKDYIKSINHANDKFIKYYLMNQERFDDEFGNGFNITNIRGDREYLVNYYDGTVVATLVDRDGNPYKISNVSDETTIIPTENVIRGDITVTLAPNGNSNWMNTQKTLVGFNWDNTINQLNSATYVWTESVSQPADTDFTEVFLGVNPGSHVSVEITEGPTGTRTGNGWYLWLKLDYKEINTGMDRTKYIRSEAFFLDNQPPYGELEVNEVR